MAVTCLTVADYLGHVEQQPRGRTLEVTPDLPTVFAAALSPAARHAGRPIHTTLAGQAAAIADTLIHQPHATTDDDYVTLAFIQDFVVRNGAGWASSFDEREQFAGIAADARRDGTVPHVLIRWLSGHLIPQEPRTP
jgi:hypothetical protein